MRTMRRKHEKESEKPSRDSRFGKDKDITKRRTCFRADYITKPVADQRGQGWGGHTKKLIGQKRLHSHQGVVSTEGNFFRQRGRA